MTSRFGYVAVLGEPNVGKSTILNAWVGQKLAITTPKAQTTRYCLRGIVNDPQGQCVIIDTPGECHTRNALFRSMRGEISQALQMADIAIVVLDVLRGKSPQLSESEKKLLEQAKGDGSRSIIVVLNKIDKLRDKAALLPWIAMCQEQVAPAAIVPVSALRADGLRELTVEVVAHLPEGEPLFASDVPTDAVERVLCAEFVREQILLHTHQEVPHGVGVVLDTFEDERSEGGGVRIEGIIYVERSSQKGILVGKGGRTIKAISSAARHEIQELLGCNVFLRMRVQVDEDWTRREDAVRRYASEQGQREPS